MEGGDVNAQEWHDTEADVHGDPITGDSDTNNEAYRNPKLVNVEKWMQTLSMKHTTHLSDLLQRRPMDFAGDIYINEQGQTEHLGDEFPIFVIPMCAGFNGETGKYFLTKLAIAKQYVRTRLLANIKAKKHGLLEDFPFLVIPIRSCGGDVSVLKSMLQAVDTFRSEFGIQIITYVIYAYSCGFIFAMNGDHVLTDMNGMLLCHEPSQSQQLSQGEDGRVVATCRTQTATSTAVDLAETEESIYAYAEIGILLRFMTKSESQEVGKWKHKSDLLLEELLKDTTLLKKWRKAWYVQHSAATRAMHTELLNKETISEGDDATNILRYILGPVVGNREGFCISTKWSLALDLVDGINSDLTIIQTDSLSLTRSLRSEVMDALQASATK